MFISSNMLSGLTNLLDVNTELQRYQTQAATGKKINQASDGLAAFLTAQGFDSRSSRLQAINDGLTGVLSTVNAAKTGLDQIKKNLADLRSTLKSASETQAQQAATGVQQLSDSDANNTQFSFQLQARFGKNPQTGVYGGQQTITADTALVQSNSSDADPAMNQSLVFIGNQAMRGGMTIKLSAGGKDWTFKIGITDATGVYGAATDDDKVANLTTVYSVGQLLTQMRDKLGIDTSMTANNATANVLATYTGPTFGKDAYGNTDVTKPLGVAVAVDYAAGSPGAVTTNGNTTYKDGYGNHETWDFNGNAGYMNVNAMFTQVRNANNNKVTYIEDQKTMKVGTAINKSFIVPGGNRTTIEKTTTNASYNDIQSASFLGVQHNFKAAVDAKNADPARANAAKAYRQTVSSINNYVSDATASGLNLLYGNSLKVTLNEGGLSQVFQITNNNNVAMTFTALGLGLVDGSGSPVDALGNFNVNNENSPGLMAAIDKVDAALNTVNAGTFQVSNFQAGIQDRKDFNTSIVKLLNQASVDLTGADATETAAKTSSLQIQQSFAQGILYSTKQTEQSLLQLLR